MKNLKKITEWKVWSRYNRIEWTVIVAGILSIFFLFINVFTPFGKHTPAPQKSDAFMLSDKNAFLEVLSGTVNSPIELAPQITTIIGGNDFLEDLLKEIDGAERSIYITNYIWDDGEFGNTLFEAVTKKAKEGVAVRILLDGLGGRKASKEHIEELEKSGGKVSYFRPIRWWNIYRHNSRNHIRDFVIDDAVAYTGGTAIADDWIGDIHSTSYWHDFMFKFEGIMAERASKIFANLWSQTTGEILTITSTEPSSEVNQDAPQFISLLSTPSPDLSSNMDHFIWFSLMAAETSIKIETPYLLPNDPIEKALKEKARDGVLVEIIVPGEYTDSPNTKWASESFYPSLIEAGVKIYEYKPSRIHSKTITIDGTWSIIGSANIDNRSSRINLEAIFGVYDPEFAQDLEDQFEIDKTRTDIVTAREAGFTSIIMFPFQRLSRLFIHQY